MQPSEEFFVLVYENRVPQPKSKYHVYSYETEEDLLKQVKKKRIGKYPKFKKWKENGKY